MSRLDKTHNLPLYQKAQLIYQLVESLLASLPEEDSYLQDTKHFMREDAMLLSAKIAGAEGGDLYSIRMQNAAIIREHAMHLYVQVGSLRMHQNYKELEYVQLIRKEIDEFRLLFIEWVESFDSNNTSGTNGVYSIHREPFRQAKRTRMTIILTPMIFLMTTTLAMTMNNPYISRIFSTYQFFWRLFYPYPKKSRIISYLALS